MGDESFRADLKNTTAEIEELRAQLAVLPGTAAATDRAYLQQSILALRKEELLLQRLLLAQGAGALTKYSQNSVALPKPSRL